MIEAVQRDGTCWLSGTTWHGIAAMPISVSSWATTNNDVERSLESIERPPKLASAEAKLSQAKPSQEQRRSIPGRPPLGRHLDILIRTPGPVKTGRLAAPPASKAGPRQQMPGHQLIAYCAMLSPGPEKRRQRAATGPASPRTEQPGADQPRAVIAFLLAEWFGVGPPQACSPSVAITPPPGAR